MNYKSLGDHAADYFTAAWGPCRDTKHVVRFATLLTALILSEQLVAKRSYGQEREWIPDSGISYFYIEKKLLVRVGDFNRWPGPIHSDKLPLLSKMGPIDQMFIEGPRGLAPGDYDFLLGIGRLRMLAVECHHGETDAMMKNIASCNGLEVLQLSLDQVTASDLEVVLGGSKIKELALSSNRFSKAHIQALVNSKNHLKRVEINSTGNYRAVPSDLILMSALKLEALRLINFSLSDAYKAAVRKGLSPCEVTFKDPE